MAKFKSEIEIEKQGTWLKDIKFRKIRDKEKSLLQAAKDKLKIILSTINPNCIDFNDEIIFGQFDFVYFLYGNGRFEVEICLQQQTAGGRVYLDEDQWDEYLCSLPYQVFHYYTIGDWEEHYPYPIVRVLSEWSDLEKLECWINDGGIEDWFLEKFAKELKKKLQKGE